MQTISHSEPDILSLLENGFNEETANFLYEQGKQTKTETYTSHRRYSPENS